MEFWPITTKHLSKLNLNSKPSKLNKPSNLNYKPNKLSNLNKPNNRPNPHHSHLNHLKTTKTHPSTWKSQESSSKPTKAQFSHQSLRTSKNCANHFPALPSSFSWIMAKIYLIRRIRKIWIFCRFCMRRSSLKIRCRSRGRRRLGGRKGRMRWLRRKKVIGILMRIKERDRMVISMGFSNRSWFSSKRLMIKN